MADKETQCFVLRALAALALGLIALLYLGCVLWDVQIRNATEYASRENRQSVRRVRLPEKRGRILDRNGRILADNRPGYGIAVYVEELRQPGRIENTVEKIDQVVERLSELLGLEREIDTDFIGNHVRSRRPLPLPAWRDIGEDALARFAESHVAFPGSPERMPGVDVMVESIRVYPQGALAAHVLGHVGQADPDRHIEEPYHYYLPSVEGRNGVELYRDAVLQGQSGGYLLRVDASGFKHREIARRDPVPGADIWLALDSDVQRAAERALQDIAGAAVVLDPRNGDVLALASSPSFDPNVFGSGLSPREWRRLTDDSRRPLFHRAISGVYPPGSVYKMAVAIPALENERSTPATTFSCSGTYVLGNVSFDCWLKSGHGRVDLRQAIAQSCNVYFYHLGLQCGYERMYRMADAIGFGRRTGIDLPGEAAGLLPDGAWKRETLGDDWRPGDTCNVSIGQGALSVTPLQMAVMTAAIANGGRVFRPRMLLHSDEGRFEARRPPWAETPIPGEMMANLNWSRTTLDTVRYGMLDCVQARDGTGPRARLEGVRMAGKTGTAQFRRQGKPAVHAWMVVYAPFDHPRVAAALVVEDASGGGGLVAAPRMRGLMAAALGLEPDAHGFGEDGP